MVNREWILNTASVAKLNGALKWNEAIIKVVDYTCALPALRSKNVQ